jgi:hypothetical protein
MKKEKGYIDGHSVENILNIPELALRMSAIRAITDILNMSGIDQYSLEQVNGVVAVMEQWHILQDQADKNRK